MSLLSTWWHKWILGKEVKKLPETANMYSPLKNQIGATAKVARVIKGAQAGLVQLTSNGEVYEAKAQPGQTILKETVVRVVGYEGWYMLYVSPL